MTNGRNLVFIPLVLILPACGSQEISRGPDPAGSFTVVALGDAGEKSSELRSNAKLIGRMQTGEHDGGQSNAIIFLGDNFYETGLNVPAGEVESTVDAILGRFDGPIAELGRSNVHAVPGNHDYYTSHAFSASALFGLISVDIGPIGLSDRGNERAKALGEWSYYYHYPASARYPVHPASTDSVEFIFFDSARLLRTEPERWNKALDSLTTLLRASAGRQGILWRVLAVHHPFRSLGEHGGYSSWNDETNDVDYLTACDRDSNALGWFKNLIDPEDLCTERYRLYREAMKTAIHDADAKIHLILSGHDHSLQLLSGPAHDTCAFCPQVQIISGAASKRTTVRRPMPPSEFTSFDPKTRDGTSVHGFVQLRFSDEVIEAAFFRGGREELIDMGGGRTRFRIDATGRLIPE